MEEQSDADAIFIFDNDKREEDPVEDVAWDSHDLQDSSFRGTPALQAIQDLCTKYNVKELSSLVDALTNIEDGMSSIPGVVELTDKLPEVKEECLTHTKEHATEFAQLNGLAFQRIVLQQMTADTLRGAFGAVVSLAASPKKARDEARKAFKECDEQKLKWEQENGAEEGWSTSATKTIDEPRGLLEQVCDTIFQMTEDYKERLTVEKSRSDSFKAQVTDLTGQVGKVEELLCTSHLKERAAFATVRTLDAQRRNVLGHLHTLRSKMPGFQACVAVNIEDEFSAFCRRLAALLSDLTTARRRGISGALNVSVAPLRELLAEFKEDLARSAPSITGNLSSNQ